MPFNISRLFKWQNTNRFGSDEAAGQSCDGVSDWFNCYVCFSVGSSQIPHFSSPALTDNFAFTEHLNYIYYLRRGQPSFAFANFVAAKLIGHSNTSKRSVYSNTKVVIIAVHPFGF